MSKKREYTPRVICLNCDYDGYVTIPKGTPIANSECPECGCCSLEKFFNIEDNYSDGEINE